MLFLPDKSSVVPWERRLREDEAEKFRNTDCTLGSSLILVHS